MGGVRLLITQQARDFPVERAVEEVNLMMMMPHHLRTEEGVHGWISRANKNIECGAIGCIYVDMLTRLGLSYPIEMDSPYYSIEMDSYYYYSYCLTIFPTPQKHR